MEGNIFALRDIYMVREALEPLVAREAARHITEEALGELRQIVDQTAHAAALPPEDANANLMAQLDEKFHEKICESTNNPFLVSLYKQFIPALHTYRLNSFAILKNCSNVVEPHRRIMEALAQHDAEAADLEMRRICASRRTTPARRRATPEWTRSSEKQGRHQTKFCQFPQKHPIRNSTGCQ